MEVATIITSSKAACSLFDDFIYSYSSLHLIQKDDDTAYFRYVFNEKGKIFYHYKFVDPGEEFGYNYSEEEVAQIKGFYGQKQIFMFDLSYRPEALLIELLKAFKFYIKTHNINLLSDVLISHPFDGLKSLNENY